MRNHFVKKWVGAIVVWMLLGSLTACSKTPEQQIAEQLELGQKYLIKMEYEEAIVAFEKVIELDPRQWDAYKGLAEVYEEQGDYEMVVKSLERGMEIIGAQEVPQKDVRQLTKYYEQMAEEAEAEGDTEQIKEYYEKLLELKPKGDDIRQRLEILEHEKELLEMAKSMVDNENYSFADTLILSDEFQNLIHDLKSPLIFRVENGLYMGIYPGGYIYYGEMHDGIREGQGSWYYGDTKRITVVEGTWKGDMPNGPGRITDIINMDLVEKQPDHVYAQRVIETCNLVDGIYEGGGTIIWETDRGYNHEWDVNYENGALLILDGEIVSYCKICGAHLLVSLENFHQVEGLTREEGI